MEKRVIIVGGGYVGADLASRLDRSADVTLVEPRDAFVHSAAMIRAVLKPDLLDRALLPYHSLLRNGRVVQARVSDVGADSVTLEDGTTLEADVIVVATGSAYAAPFKPAGDSIPAFRQANADAHDALRAAGSIAIVGAGAVGIELAGEIRAAMPDRSVTLVSETPTLLPEHPPRLGAELTRQLGVLGVEVRFAERAEVVADPSAPFRGPLKLENGETLQVDLVFPALGARPQNALLRDLPGARIGANGRVLVDRYLRPSDYPNVLAAGDAVDTGDAMSIVGTLRQLPWLENAVRTLLRGGRLERILPYAPWRKPPIILPLGPQMGASSVPPAGVRGPTTTRLLKGRTLLIPKYRRQFGLA
ncbi:NAD(P)/FAD-dependent oxidoreductase [Tropicimonas isoalkanivorans]|uniref:NADH dehydrogenase, FAD-containing subunit n=1 Tax=Tropicimonas isoalkanivorans TaxID=441112 RepID=A0A1I1KG72_9RHOB|nr:FAD-dependent oxidoreductase [Tropicimonas isoalkanivorans]SFC56460.1 NADH dehydrogenase, FAD-containing subunit [Tropicimonas isoalkanivorans]